MGSNTNHRGQSGQYEFDIPLESVTSQGIAAFHAYWAKKCREGQLPSRTDILPWEIPGLLPDLILIEIEREPLRFRIRLSGTRNSARRGDNTGKYLDEITSWDAGRKSDYLKEMEFVANNRRPAFSRDWLTSKFGVRHNIFAGIWPLASDGRLVDMLVVMEDWEGRNPSDFDLKRDILQPRQG